jgi:dihydroxyacetone kinase-like predicted kinase
MPHGVAAALAFDPDESVAKNLAALEAALESVTTVELTVAAATRTADGVEAREGEVIALVDDRLVASEASVTQALRAGLIAAGAPGASLITLYAGAEVDADERERLRATAAEVAPKAEVELIDGGQRLYPVIASIE